MLAKDAGLQAQPPPMSEHLEGQAQDSALPELPGDWH